MLCVALNIVDCQEWRAVMNAFYSVVTVLYSFLSEENAVVITKTPHTPTCPTTRERTSTTSTTESRVPAPRPSQDPSESRTDIPVSRDTPTLRPAPTVPSTPGSAPKGASSIGRQLRQFWNSLRDRPTASKASWFGGLRRRPKCPLIPEQLYSPPNSNRCCANVDRQLPAVPPATTLRRFAPGPPSPLGPASVNGACRNPASPRLGRSRDDCGALPTRSPGRGLRRCNDADLYGSHHARPEEMLMY
uniref:Uncharacterized protein n=1 Tax=Steinernema glaseri TaxID=37863 RepID=A0A1I7Z8Q0_9BILA